jgi:hypothetical protein
LETATEQVPKRLQTAKKHHVAAVLTTQRHLNADKRPKEQKDGKKRYLSGGESNPGLLRVDFSNDKQKY